MNSNTYNLIRKNIIDFLDEQKSFFINELNLGFIKEIKIKEDLLSKIDELFNFDETILKDYWDQKKIDDTLLPELIKIDNIKKACDVLYKFKYISNKRYQFYVNSISSDKSNLVILEIQKRIKEILNTEAMQYYLNWFNLVKIPFIDDLSFKVKKIKEIQEKIKPFVELFGSFWDLSVSNFYMLEDDSFKKIYELINDYEFVKEIAKILGRISNSFNEYEQKLIKEKVFSNNRKIVYSSPENITSITYGDDIKNLIKYQMALRNNKNSKKLFDINLLEKKLLQFDQSSQILEQKEIDKKINEKINDSNGPFIMCIDTSASMYGEPENIAKAFALAIVKIANQQKRKAYIISFSTKVEEFEVSNVSKNLNLFIEFLFKSFHGGTDINVPLEAALEKIKEDDYKNSDVIVISDFIINEFTNELKNDIKDAKKNKTRFHALSIGEYQIEENMEDFDTNLIYDGTEESIDLIIEKLNKFKKQN